MMLTGTPRMEPAMAVTIAVSSAMPKHPPELPAASAA